MLVMILVLLLLLSIYLYATAFYYYVEYMLFGAPSFAILCYVT